MGFAALALICAVALVGPVLSLPRFGGLPVVIGELLVGVVVGLTGLQLLDPADPTFGFLAEVGFALVMLVAGSQVPVRSPGLRSGLTVGVLRAAGVMVLAAPVGYAVATVFGTGHGALYAVLLASSSAGLVMPALSGVEAGSPELLRLLAQLAVADAACIVALPLVIDPAHAQRAAMGGAVVLAAAGLVFLALRWAVRSGRQRAVHELSEGRGLAVELRTSLTLLFALAALAAYFHVSVMLAGFAAGVALAGAGEPRRVAHQLFALTEGFLGPIFFVWLGCSLDLRELIANPSAIGLGVVLGLAAVVVHTLPALTGQPWPAATITAAQLGVPVAAATIGTATGMLRPGEDAAMLLGALVTVVATALVATRVRSLA